MFTQWWWTCRVKQWQRHPQGHVLEFWLHDLVSGFISIYLLPSCLCKCVPREKMDALAKHYVTCTKEDTMMNVWLVRAKCDPYWSMFVKIAYIYNHASFLSLTHANIYFHPLAIHAGSGRHQRQTNRKKLRGNVRSRLRNPKGKRRMSKWKRRTKQCDLDCLNQVHVACPLFGYISRSWQAVICRILGLLRTWLAAILWGSMVVTMGLVDLKLCFFNTAADIAILCSTLTS